MDSSDSSYYSRQQLDELFLQMIAFFSGDPKRIQHFMKVHSFARIIGDIVKLKKPHPCGSHEWEILRVGADFRLKCTGCGHQMMVTRKLVEKNTRGLRKPE